MAHLRTTDLVEEYGIPEGHLAVVATQGRRSTVVQARQDRVL
jgi:hypothetical protein